jgi:hypothetical protein
MDMMATATATATGAMASSTEMSSMDHGMGGGCQISVSATHLKPNRPHALQSTKLAKYCHGNGRGSEQIYSHHEAT